MTPKLDKHAEAIMSRVWPRYTAAVPAHGDPVDVYRAERDAYVREINTSDAVVGAVDIIAIPGPAGAIPARVYRPLGEHDAPLPVLLYLHGGGWTVGGGDTLDGTYRAFCAATGCLLLAPDYRLAPEHKFPAGLQDCWAVAQWLARHAGEIGGDPARIAVGGESSGGNMAAVLSAMSRTDPAVDFRIQALVYPALDLRANTPSYLNGTDTFTRDKMNWYIESYIRSEADRRDPLASPVLAETFVGLPRTVLISGGADPLLDEAEDYAERLRQAGVEIEYLRLEGWPHGFAFWPETEAYRTTLAVVSREIRKSVGLS